MKQYSTKAEFLIGLVGVIIHSVVVVFFIGYLLNPSTLDVMIEQATGEELALLQQFAQDVESLGFLIYAGSAIVVFEWIALFRIRRYANRMTPVWGLFLILGALYAYFYFGGVEVFVLLTISGILTIYRYRTHNKAQTG